MALPAKITKQKYEFFRKKSLTLNCRTEKIMLKTGKNGIMTYFIL